MKHIIIVLIFSCLVLPNCEKEISYPVAPIHFPGEQEYGWVRATKNGSAFEASGYICVHRERPNDFFGISWDTYTEFGELRESFSIFEMEYTTGRRSLVREDSDEENGIAFGYYATSSDDGDVAEDTYRLDERQSNWIDITAIDTIAGEPILSGTFSLHFKMSRENRNPDNPEHVRFTDGTFEVRLPD